MNYKTGLLKAPNPPTLRFGAYFNETALPSIPATFGHYDLIPPMGWKMLGNDTVGDCTIAGPMHLVMLWKAIIGQHVAFSTADAIDDYSTITGFVRTDPSTDTGADMVQVAKYWRDIGMRDENAERHKIIAYLQIDPTNTAHLDAACYLFDGGVGLGVQVPSNAQDQFDAGQPWSGTSKDIEGYHYVPYVGKDNAYRKVVTWGQLQNVATDWWLANVQEAVVVISNEAWINGKSAEGFDQDALIHDLESLA